MLDRRAAELMKPPGQLPLVDPDFLLVERRAETLHAYARGLLQHLRHIRAGGKAGGYPIATIKAAAVWLIESYSEALVAPAPEAATLVSEIVRPHRGASTLPVRRSSETPYWAAIEFEARHRPDPTGKEPSMAKRYAVAKYIFGPAEEQERDLRRQLKALCVAGKSCRTTVPTSCFNDLPLTE